MNFIFHWTNKKRIVRMASETNSSSTVPHACCLTRARFVPRSRTTWLPTTANAQVCSVTSWRYASRLRCDIPENFWVVRSSSSTDSSEFRRRWTRLHPLIYAYVSVSSLERENYYSFCHTMFEVLLQSTLDCRHESACLQLLTYVFPSLHQG